MKANRSLLFAVSLVFSSLLISCASTPEMSAEEERMATGGELASASSTTKEETAVSDAPSDAPPDMKVYNEEGSDESAGTSASYDPGIPSSESEATSKESLPLSGELATNEESKEAPVSGSVSASGLGTPPSSTEPTLVMPSLSEPTLVAPSKKGSKKKSRAKKATQVSDNAVTTPTEETAPVAQEVDTQAAKNAVANQVVINDKVVEKDGVKLNRYYFLRPGDHTEKVSELLYGNRNMSDKLLKWNGGIEQWVPGNMIWYNSPVDKNDTKLHSFYEESHVALKEYKVQKGDSLKVLAARFYGDIRCWAELAHINSLGKDASNVSEGSTLKFAPEKLGTTTVQAEAVKAPADAEDVDPFLAADKAHEAAPQVKKEKKLASAEVGSFLMNNMFLILTVTIALGLIVFMMKRKDKDPMEF